MQHSRQTDRHSGHYPHGTLCPTLDWLVVAVVVVLVGVDGAAVLFMMFTVC